MALLHRSAGSLLMAATVSLLPAVARAADAQISDEVPAVEIVIPGRPTSRPVATPVKRSPYEQKKQASGAKRLSSLGEVQASYETLGDRVAEVKGEVKGVISSGGGRTCWLELEGAMISLALPEGPALDPSLRPGTLVRCLVTSNRRASVAAPLAIVAATSEPEVTVFPSTPSLATGVSEPMVVPPMVSQGLPPATGIEMPGSAASQPRVLSPRSDNTTIAIPKATAPGTETQRAWFKAFALQSNRRLTERQASEIADALIGAGQENALDPRFLAAIISVESDFDIYCKSYSGAMGLGQLMPFNVPEAHISDPWNPTQNIYGTARLLRGHLNDYRGRSDATLLAVAAYNAGPGAVRRAGYQVPGGQQVQRYVWKVYYRYKSFAPDMFPQ